MVKKQPRKAQPRAHGLPSETGEVRYREFDQTAVEVQLRKQLQTLQNVVDAYEDDRVVSQSVLEYQVCV